METLIGMRPTAWLPVAMSVAALLLVIVQVATHGAAPEPDEGASAHLWQLLMGAQVPLVLSFAVRWLRRAPAQAIPILVFQLVAAGVALMPVVVLGW